MNILIDIGHPAHVHYYRNLAVELKASSHKVIWVVKDIAIARQLLEFYRFNYILLPKKSDGFVGKLFMQLVYDWLLWKTCKREKIDIAIGTSASIAHISRISSVKSIVFDDDDDEVQPFFTKYVHPFADTLMSPIALKGKRTRKDTIYYPGTHELAYLHPKRFNPDPSVLKEVGIEEGETFFLLRFNVFKAHHDLGVSGLNIEQKLKLIKILEPYGKVFITTEREVNPELKKYKLKINPENIHSLLAYSTLFISDSQTMTSEAATLGVPSVRCNSFAGRLSNLEELEHSYDLTFAFLPSAFDKMLIKINELLSISNLQEEWQKRRWVMLKDKIDVTAFWTWYIENYPQSEKHFRDEYELWELFM